MILIQLASGEVHRSPSSEHCCRRLFLGASQPLADDSLASREIERIEPQCAVLRIGQSHAHAITLHDVANAPRNLSKQFPQLEVRYHTVGQIKEKFQTILRALRGLKIERVIGGESDLVGNQRKKAHLFFGIRIGKLTGDEQASQTAVRSAQGKSAYRLNSIFPKPFHHAGKAWLTVDE